MSTPPIQCLTKERLGSQTRLNNCIRNSIVKEVCAHHIIPISYFVWGTFALKTGSFSIGGLFVKVFAYSLPLVRGNNTCKRLNFTTRWIWLMHNRQRITNHIVRRCRSSQSCRVPQGKRSRVRGSTICRNLTLCEEARHRHRIC